MEKRFIVHFALAFMHFLNFIFRHLMGLMFCKKPPGIPPIKNSILKLSATALAKKIRDGELSCQAVVEAYIARIKEVDPFLNAVIEDRFEAALDDAKIYDAKLKAGEVTVSTLEKEKPLYGVPVTVKETCSLKGLSYTAGSLARQGVKATEDGVAVELLKKAGAIPLCVTNVSEMCAALHSANYVYGETKNPYDLRRTSGGSSGGEAALLGAGASVLGIGSDFLGSVRIPALYCGIFAHKPTAEIISLDGHFPTAVDSLFKKMLVLGPMARYAEDLHLGMKILSSECDIDLRLDESVDVQKLNIYYLDNFDSFCGTWSTTSDIRRAIKEATRYLTEKGARVEHMTRDWIQYMFPLLISMVGEMKLPKLLLDSKDPERKKSPLLEMMKMLLHVSDHTFSPAMLEVFVDCKGFTTSAKIESDRKRRLEIRQKLIDILGDNGVLISPTMNTPAPYPRSVCLQLDCCVYSAFANTLHLPATHVTTGLNEEGLPIGFQVIAAPNQDRLCLAMAKELEKAFGGWIPPSS